MTGQAERRTGVVHDEKIAELVIVWIVAGGALHTAFMVQFHHAGQLAGIFDFRIVLRQGRIINERNGMVGGQIRAEIVRPHGHRRGAALHGNWQRAAADTAECDGTIVTAQA